MLELRIKRAKTENVEQGKAGLSRTNYAFLTSSKAKTILVKSENETLTLTAVEDTDLTDDKIRLDKETRTILGKQVGDLVEVLPDGLTQIARKIEKAEAELSKIKEIYDNSETVDGFYDALDREEIKYIIM